MSEDNSGEKTFDPTEKKKKDAAKKGDVLRSKELGTLVAIAAGGAMLLWVGPWLFSSLTRIAQTSFRFNNGDLGNFMPGAALSSAAADILPPIFTIGGVVLVLSLGTQLLLGEGSRVNPEALKPKGSRIDPMKGLKRIFGVQGLIELGKGILKLVLLAGIAWWWAAGNVSALLSLGRGSLQAQLGYAWDAVASLVGLLLIGLLIIAMIDYPLQRFQRNKRLKMSHKDMRDEGKQTEGSPEVKSARRQRQRDLARGSVGKAMKEAQFVVTNPMHFAVAMTYDPDLAPAPVVLAKGRGETALAMRELAVEEDVPVLEYPSLARAIYFTTQANQVVREELYVAIAALVAFVLSLKRGEIPLRPQIDVPEDLLFDADGNPENLA